MRRATLIDPGDGGSHLDLYIQGSKAGRLTRGDSRRVVDVKSNRALIGHINSCAELPYTSAGSCLSHCSLVSSGVRALQFSGNLVEAIGAGAGRKAIFGQIGWISRTDECKQVLDLGLRQWPAVLVEPGRHLELGKSCWINTVGDTSADDAYDVR